MGPISGKKIQSTVTWCRKKWTHLNVMAEVWAVITQNLKFHLADMIADKVIFPENFESAETIDCGNNFLAFSNIFYP